MNGKKKDRNRAASSPADVEPDAGDGQVGAEAVTPFDSPVCVTFISVRRRLADPDGLSGKAAIDGIVALGLLSDDSPKQIQSVSFSQTTGRVESTRIVIEEVDCGEGGPG